LNFNLNYCSAVYVIINGQVRQEDRLCDIGDAMPCRAVPWVPSGQLVKFKKVQKSSKKFKKVQKSSKKF
jgi:hypothetical protein